jgi:hypothetical protein
MRAAQKILKVSRKIHLYTGIFIAPALLFFSITGALQTFNLHESTTGSRYAPPRWIVVLGQLHKKQTTEVPARRARPTGGAAGDGPDGSIAGGRGEANARSSGLPSGLPKPEPGGGPPAAAKRHMPMKIFFLVVSVGLALSTLTGIYMALRYSRKLTVAGLLAAGVVVPCLLLVF